MGGGFSQESTWERESQPPLIALIEAWQLEIEIYGVRRSRRHNILNHTIGPGRTDNVVGKS